MSVTASTPATRGEGRVVLTGVSWSQYEGFLALLDDHPSVRLHYLTGELEIMTTSPEHERVKSMIRRLIEHYAFVERIDLRAYGSTTFREEAVERGAEPDECYVLGRDVEEAPDLAIEVVITHGGLDKLAIYRGLGVAEVWFWQEGAISIHRLGDDGYARVPRSAFVPGLDPDLLARFVSRSDQLDALTDFDRTLRAGS